MPKTTTQASAPATGTTKRKSTTQPSDQPTAPSTANRKRKSATPATAATATTKRKAQATTPEAPTPPTLQLVQAWIVEQQQLMEHLTIVRRHCRRRAIARNKFSGCLHISSCSENATVSIGTDFVRSRSELQKLRLFAQAEPLTLATVQALLECRTQNALQLATAMRTGAVAQVAQLMQELLTKSEPILVIIATLLTQFRTWLWVKSAMLSGIQRDAELARLCQIHNPNRLYYLRQEVANLSVASLVATIQDLLRLETTLKQGRLRAIAVLPAVVTIARRFQLA